MDQQPAGSCSPPGELQPTTGSGPRSRLARLARDQSGVAAIEAALTFPMLILLFLGIVNVADYANNLNKVVTASALVGDLVSRNDTTVTSAAITDYFEAAELAIWPIDIDNVRLQVAAYRKTSGTINSKPQWTVSSNGGEACDTVDTTQLTDLVDNGQDVIVSVACTEYVPPVVSFMWGNILGFSSITIREQMAMRPRISSTIGCTGC
jgi:Flp pilus assembly protein TadG